MLQGFAPLADSHSRVLILGSMPSVQSLAKGQYYGNGQNAFWRIVYTLWGDVPDAAYSRRCAFLLAHGIALWDTLAGCERSGSLDSAIKKPQVNDFGAFFTDYPAIRQVFFNGQAAARLFLRQGGEKLLGGRPYQVLPSTSPAYTLPYAAKLAAWQTVKTAAA